MAQQQRVPAFEESTRLRRTSLEAMDKGTGATRSNKTLPPVGYLAAIHYPIQIVVSGTLSAPNAYGLAAAVDRLTVKANNGVTPFDQSGIGYHYITREFLNENLDDLGWTNARAAVTTGTFRLDMIVPIAHNIRDVSGLIVLQNQATIVDHTIQWLADATLATGATVTGTCRPNMWTYDVPPDQRSRPVQGLRLSHQILEETKAIAAAGKQKHQLQIGGVYVTIGGLFKSGFNTVRLVAQQSNQFEEDTPEQHRLRFATTNHRDSVLAGAITGIDKRFLYDLAGSDGLGQYDAERDYADARVLTDLFVEIDAIGADTLYVVRRQFVTIRSGRAA